MTLPNLVNRSSKFSSVQSWGRFPTKSYTSMTLPNLEDLFTKFGRVIDVRINQKQGRNSEQGARGGKTQPFVPNFGFVVFETSDAVLRTLAAKPIMLYGTHRLNVEEKKMRREGGQDRGQGDRQFQGRDQGNRGSQDNLRGAGHPGGRG